MAKQILEKETVEKRTFEVGTTINGKATNLVVELSCNGNKGLINVSCKITDSQITGEALEDKGTIVQIGEIMAKAIKVGVEWKTKWQEAKDDGQTKMTFGMDDDGESEN